MVKIQRIVAVMKARFREFYRDSASWIWNLLMPMLILVGFAFIFSTEDQDVFKVAVYPSLDQVDLQAFADVRYIKLIEASDFEPALSKVDRHQLDMLIAAGTPLRYWINEFAPNGYLVEKILLQAFAADDISGLQRDTVSGRNIRYADWLMPGVLAMNMMFSCLWGVGWVVVRYRKNGVLRRLQVTPLTPFEFLTAQVLARLVVIMAMTLLVFVGADLLIGVPMRGSYLALLLVLLCGAACLTSMGLVVATRLKTEEVADGLLNLIAWPMMIMSGVWFSMEGTHPVAQQMAQLFPLTHLVNATRSVMIEGAGVIDVAFEIGLLSALTLLLLLLSARLFRWA